MLPSVLRYALACISLLACDEWRLSVNSDGLVFISVIRDGAAPRHRFRVRSRGSGGIIRTLDVPASGRLQLPSGGAGEMEITLLPPGGCRVMSENPRTLSVAAHETVQLAFDVRCP